MQESEMYNLWLRDIRQLKPGSPADSSLPPYVS